MTIRFGSKVRLAPCDRWRIWQVTHHDPGDIESFAELVEFMERYRALVIEKSEGGDFLRWLIDREWKRLSPGSGYVN